MSYLMYTLNIDGTIEETRYDKHPSLDVLQKAVGGYIEAIPHFMTYHGRPCMVYANEEGKIMNLPTNISATKAWADGRIKLVGTIVVVVKE